MAFSLGTKEILAALLQAVGAVGGAATQPSLFQPRFPLGAPGLINKASGHLEDVFKAFEKDLGTPITLPDAVARDLPTFTGGGLPMPIGISTGTASGTLGLPTPPTLPEIMTHDTWTGPEGHLNPPPNAPGPHRDPNEGAPGDNVHVVSVPPTRQRFSSEGGPQRFTSEGAPTPDDQGYRTITEGPVFRDPSHAALSLLQHIASGGGA